MLLYHLQIFLLLPLGIKTFKFLQPENRLIPTPVKFEHVMFHLDAKLTLTHSEAVDFLKTARNNTEIYAKATSGKAIGGTLFSAFSINIPKTLKNLEDRFDKIFDPKFNIINNSSTHHASNSCKSDVFTLLDDRIYYSYSVLETIFKDLPNFADYNVTKKNLQILIATLGNIYYHLDSIIQNVDNFLIIRDSLDNALFTHKLKKDLYSCFPSFMNYEYDIINWYRNSTKYYFFLNIIVYDYSQVSGYLSIPYFNKMLGYKDQLLVQKVSDNYGSIRCNTKRLQCDFYSFSKLCSLHLGNDSLQDIVNHCPFSDTEKTYEVTDRYLAVYSLQLAIDVDGIHFPLTTIPYILESKRAIKVFHGNMEYNFGLPLAVKENEIYHTSFNELELDMIEKSFKNPVYKFLETENLWDVGLAVMASTTTVSLLVLIIYLFKHCVSFVTRIKEALADPIGSLDSKTGSAASLNAFRPRRNSLEPVAVNSLTLSPMIRKYLSTR